MALGEFRNWQWQGDLFGLDMTTNHPGELIYDQVAQAPMASSKSYVSWMAEYCGQNQIKVLIPTSEVIAKLSGEGLSDFGQTSVLLTNKSAVALSLDKLLCMRFWKTMMLWSRTMGWFQATPKFLSVIIKPRFGRVVLTFTDWIIWIRQPR